MREVLKKLLKVGLVVVVLLAPVVISGTVMEGEVWAAAACPSGVTSYMQKPEIGGAQTSQQLKKAEACSFDSSEYSGGLKEIARLGYSNGWINGYVSGFYSDIGQNAPIEKELSNREIERECEKRGITGVSGLDDCVTTYNIEYDNGRGDGQDFGGARANDACPDGGCSVGSNGEVIAPSGGEDEDEDEDEDEEGGPGNSGGGTSGGNSSGGNSSGGGTSGGSGFEMYEPGEGSGMDGSTSTNILPEKWKIDDILRFIVNVLMYGLGAAATIGVVVAGIQYLTARDNEQQVTAAKRRLFNVVLGLAAWAMLYTLLHWLIPGFNDDLLEGGKDESGMVEESEIAKETGSSL